MARRFTGILPVTLAVLIGMHCITQAEQIDEGARKTVVSALNSLLKTVDKNGDQQIDATERGALEQYVEDTYGQQWLAPLKQVLDQADADADAVLTKAEWDRYAESPAPDQASKETVMVTMSDGIRLATDIYLPAGEGPWPVILMRTPYNKDSSGHNLPGAVTVIQDHRGRFASEGWNLPFVGCGWDVYHDGKDTVDWIRRQPWSDGRVFSVGGSALGITQNYLAAANPDGLQSQYIVVAAADLYQHAIYVGGAYRQSQVEGWVTGNKFDAETLRTYKAHPTKDRFWARFDSLDRESKINVPAIHVGGWFDTFSLGTVQSYRSRQHHGGPDARGKQKLVMGPWTHGVGQPIEIRGDKFPDHDVPSRYTTGDWARQTVLGEDTGYLAAPAVAYYALGDVDDPAAPGNEWRYADDWPIPCAPTSFYLHADGLLSQQPPAERAESDSLSLVFDPDDPCPTRGGCNLVIEAGPLEQNDIEGRDDVLTFTSTPLDAPMEITGHPQVRMFLASSAVDTDLSVRITDVYPDGKSYLMAEGMLRVRYRNSLSEPELMVSGNAYELTFETWPISVVFNQGHRIRLAITSSNYPRFDRNPGTGETWDRAKQPVKQTNRIFCSAQQPSQIVLPLIK